MSMNSNIQDLLIYLSNKCINYLYLYFFINMLLKLHIYLKMLL